MRITVSFLLLFLYICSWVKPYAPYLEYALNYSYIVTVLCENKAVPALKCNGTCHLNKELNKVVVEEEKASKELTPIQSEIKEVFYTCDIFTWNKPIYNILTSNSTQFKVLPSKLIYFDIITPPPQVLS